MWPCGGLNPAASFRFLRADLLPPFDVAQYHLWAASGFVERTIIVNDVVRTMREFSGTVRVRRTG